MEGAVKQAFQEYLTEMGMASPDVQKRFFDLYHAAAKLFPGEIGEIFISQSDHGDGGVPTRESLWFFSRSHALEARQFLVRDDLEVLRLEGLQAFRCLAGNFDLQKMAPAAGSPSPSLLLEFNPSRGGRCVLHAYGSNCKKLASIALEYLRPNVE